MTRKNIKLPKSLFMALRDDKGKHMSWPTYLEQQCLTDDTDTQQPVTLEATEINKIAEQVARELDNLK